MNQITSEHYCRLLIENIRVSIDTSDADVLEEARRRLRRIGGFGEIISAGLHRKSIDARRRVPQFVCSVLIEAAVSAVPDTARLAEHSVKLSPEEKLILPSGSEVMNGRPVIIGFGPAGIFAALLLAECGFRPLVLEMGGDVDARIQAVDRFHREGVLLPHTNIQFGAGGAGTFSDGKLTTRIGDSRCGYVLRKLVALGAPESILWQAKPHVGTDVLRAVIREADRAVRLAGGEIRYHARAEHITEDSLYVGQEKIPFGTLVIACGHSSRPLYRELIASGFSIERKPFSVGVRVEHLQEDIDAALYGKYAGLKSLPHAEYALSYRRGDRGCYSFCMCPGGLVVGAASEEGGVVTNGMSYYARDGRNANAALAVSVHPQDAGDTPLDSIAFQRALEEKAFALGGGTYAAPCQTVGDFLSDKEGTVAKRIRPTYRDGNVVYTDLHRVLPAFVTEMLAEGLRDFGRRIRGFDASDVPLTGVETRTSAPVRILRRDGILSAPDYDRIYPCGEGAGYAGGIMSAAVDGIRVAEAILARYRAPRD